MKRAGGVLLTLGAAWPAAGFLPANRVLPSSPQSTSRTALSATAQLSKFDRIKANWKGKPLQEAGKPHPHMNVV